ncbi:MAG: hypothetical protein COB49_12415 [Alphaproteobacteria bacterium]|nr:MAG: hypothetical protein COB49_12415 [Alphaproteobacteria bacterium]
MVNNVMTGKNDKVIEDAPEAGSFYTRNKYRILLGAILALALCGAIIFARSSALASLSEDQAVHTQALVVNTLKIVAKDHYQVKQKYSGNIVAGRESDHGFDKAGLLADVLVDEGDQVKKGDILARLDMRRLEASKKILDAALAEAKALNVETKALLDRAEATYDRYRILLDKKHISEQKFDQVKFDLIALKARKVATAAAVTQSEARLESLETDRALATLTARFEGSVVRRYLDEGTALNAATPVIRLIEDRKLEIHVGLPSAAASLLTPGENHIFDFQGSRITTKLRTILKKLDQSTRTVTAIFDVTDKTTDIRSGNLARLTIDMDIQQKGFWLPSSALAESRRGLWSVYTLKPHKNSAEYATLLRQELQVLYTNSDHVFVRGTLRDGDRVVSGGLHRLVPGQLVRITGKTDHVE